MKRLMKRFFIVSLLAASTVACGPNLKVALQPSVASAVEAGILFAESHVSASTLPALQKAYTIVVDAGQNYLIAAEAALTSVTWPKADAPYLQAVDDIIQAAYAAGL